MLRERRGVGDTRCAEACERIGAFVGTQKCLRKPRGGTSTGTWNASVNVDGSLSATATGPFAGTGSVTFGGASTIPLAGSGVSQGFAITFAGNFTLVGSGPGVSAAGSWTSSSGERGTWVGSKTN